MVIVVGDILVFIKEKIIVKDGKKKFEDKIMMSVFYEFKFFEDNFYEFKVVIYGNLYFGLFWFSFDFCFYYCGLIG